MKQTRIGVIGCGKQAGKHTVSLLNIPRVSVIAADKEKRAAEEFAERNGIEWISSPEEMLQDENVEAVILCTPTESHLGIIQQAVRANKHVFCEKPLCTSLQEVMKIQELERKSELALMTGYVYRFVPVFEEARNFLARQRNYGRSIVLGRPLSAYFRIGGRGGHQEWKHKKASGGGAINEMLVHMMDLANWFFGPLTEVEVVSCDLLYPERIINGQVVTVDAEDFVMVRALGEDGIKIYCQADLITPAFCQYVEIQCENGSFMGSIQPDMPSYLFLKERRGGYPTGRTSFQYGYRNVWDIQMLTFFLSVINGERPSCNTVADSVELMKVMHSIRMQTE